MAKQYTDLVPEPGLQDKNIWIIAKKLSGGGSGSGSSSSYLEVVDVTGQQGVVVATGTDSATGPFSAVQVLVAATFSAWSETGGTGTMTGFSIPAGVILYGQIQSFTLSAGTVRAYRAA